jgi:hypothetical protein
MRDSIDKEGRRARSAQRAGCNVVAPPATRPLPHLSVTADVQGNLTVHRDQTVDPSTRLSI